MATSTKLAFVNDIGQAAPGRLLSPKGASEFLGVPESTLAHWRSERRGPVYIKLEDRLIRYRKSDLEKYVSARIVEPLDG